MLSQAHLLPATYANLHLYTQTAVTKLEAWSSTVYFPNPHRRLASKRPFGPCIKAFHKARDLLSQAHLLPAIYVDLHLCTQTAVTILEALSSTVHFPIRIGCIS